MFVAGTFGELIVNYFSRRLPLFIGVIILFVMGVVFGSLAVQTLSEPERADLSRYLENFYTSFSQELATANKQVLARQGIVDNIIKTSGLMWLLGLTVIGAPFILGIIFIRGFVIGFTVGFIIEQMVFKGVAVAVTSILPHNILIIPAILLAGGATLSFALSAARTLLGAQENIYNQFLSCTFLVLVSCGILALAAFVEAYITPVFIHLTQGLFV